MTFLRSFWFRLVSEGVVFVAALGNAILISRVLGTEGRGYYSVLATTMLMLSLLLGEGISRSNTYLTGRERSRTPRLFANSVCYSLAVSGVLLVVFFYPEGRYSYGA